ncbi:NAD(P)-dependent oxidoreductase [Saccharothrix xinjiangensis]|uniref:NAD(P)-dependent oxidoreductase n=1 Tax=Saccharothrix xinjiangensis TaxID=204798 RepID=A0ABV9Y4M0_9PSEU
MNTERRPRTDHPTPVTVVGLGLMGRALAEAFLRGGHPTTVWNRSPEKAAPLVALGAELAGSPRDAVAASPLVVVCVSDHGAVRDLLDPLGDLLDGRVLANLTSGTSAQARETAGWAARHGGSYLDGAIMTVPQAIGTAGAVLLYSGPRSAFEEHEPVLRLLGAGTTHLGEDHGLSALHDVALLGMMWGALNGFLQGTALLGAAGVGAAAFTPYADTLLTTVAGWLPAYARQLDDGSRQPLDATLDTHLAAIEHLVEENESLGVSTELPRLFRALVDRAVASGHGDSGYAAVIEQFRRPVEVRS